MSKANLITPYGGKLVNLVVEGKEREDLIARASKLPSIKITMRNLCDLELLATIENGELDRIVGHRRLDVSEEGILRFPGRERVLAADAEIDG
jgi:ATP sulfurylase